MAKKVSNSCLSALMPGLEPGKSRQWLTSIFSWGSTILENIERLLSIPSEMAMGKLLIDPKYEPIRNLLRFRKLAEKYK